MDSEKLSYTIAEAAKVLGYTTAYVYQLIGRGEIECYRMPWGGRKLIAAEELRRVTSGKVTEVADDAE